MLVEDTADIAVAMAGTVANMPRPLVLTADTLAFVLTVGVATVLSGMRADSGAEQDADMPGMAAVLGEVITDIRTMDIPGTA
jgi:hypothetical protein